MSEPVTTVMIPAYRAEDTVRAAVESALAQTLAQLEVIVVDDGSPDPVAGVLEGVDDPRLRVIRLPRNRGTGNARNAALRAARSELVSQLDADDLWDPRYLERVRPRFEDPRVGLVYTNARLIGHPEGRELMYADADGHPFGLEELYRWNDIIAPTVTLRREALLRVGGYPGSWLTRCEDWYAYLKLTHAGWRLDYVDEPLASYRWPRYGEGHYTRAVLERQELKMWIAWALRHPRPFPRGQIRWRAGRELRRLVRRSS